MAFSPEERTPSAAEPIGSYGKRAKVDDSGPPRCADTFLPLRIDNVWLIEFLYRVPDVHDLQDVLRVGYFNSMREMFCQQLRSGGECFVDCYFGKRADGLKEVRLHVVEARPGRDTDVIMAKGQSYSFTPVRHDGGHEADKAKKKTED